MSVRTSISPGPSSADPSTLSLPPAADAPPTRDRKLKSLTPEQVAAARSLIVPVPPPKRQGERIVFPPDRAPRPAPADAPRRPRGRPRRHGPAAEAPSRPVSREQIQAARTAIAPAPAPAPSLPEAADGVDPASRAPRLNDEELDLLAGWCQDKYGPIIDLEQAAEISRLAKQTLRERVAQGQFADSVLRGRPLRFLTVRFFREVLR